MKGVKIRRMNVIVVTDKIEKTTACTSTCTIMPEWLVIAVGAIRFEFSGSVEFELRAMHMYTHDYVGTDLKNDLMMYHNPYMIANGCEDKDCNAFTIATSQVR
ncbi:hypothetical protein CLAFUW4_10053 [Fulvia fulva]|uniref:Uncharacterized protein n=1 Tax=Passalora fulva TaxID=5499 RepID=A0A9Q8UUF4_PASFU|nr:uncharacterized protein CLAFUR5_12191 [Fulvia fulva]KAK4615579.1 hypothetical protein CLAFUR4_10057 [Fulvia fulva]KAK4616411.1 hypothetical protein CLAFUR0_10055 [Fulvia fulva]UJO22871.1 hypothetical protein CLAFUR5_12191 [Fulvia fulva]WPV19332.1 hypothetical protein CLAFUW4_10053 [Fulvia fulva]WPV34139.1 hypothetical protein CLAFUW7_10054 [Fulvia fulva]